MKTYSSFILEKNLWCWIWPTTIMQFIVCSTVCSVAPSREDFLKMILTLQITWKHTLIVIESLTIVNLLIKVQFPLSKFFLPKCSLLPERGRSSRLSLLLLRQWFKCLSQSFHVSHTVRIFVPKFSCWSHSFHVSPPILMLIVCPTVFKLVPKISC